MLTRVPLMAIKGHMQLTAVHPYMHVPRMQCVGHQYQLILQAQHVPDL
jgi:hypothetical protein